MKINTPKYLKTKKKSVKNECVKNAIANVLDIFAYSFGLLSTIHHLALCPKRLTFIDFIISFYCFLAFY